MQDITSARGAYGTIDPIGGQTTAKLLTATRARGTVLIYGALSGLSFTGGIPDILFQLKTVTGFHIAEWQVRVIPLHASVLCMGWPPVGVERVSMCCSVFACWHGNQQRLIGWRVSGGRAVAIRLASFAPRLMTKSGRSAFGYQRAAWCQCHACMCAQPDVGKEKAKKAVEEVLDMLVKGVLTPNNGSSFPLHEAAEAIQAAAQPGRGGKVFLKS